MKLAKYSVAYKKTHYLSVAGFITTPKGHPN